MVFWRLSLEPEAFAATFAVTIMLYACTTSCVVGVNGGGRVGGSFEVSFQFLYFSPGWCPFQPGPPQSAFCRHCPPGTEMGDGVLLLAVSHPTPIPHQPNLWDPVMPRLTVRGGEGAGANKDTFEHISVASALRAMKKADVVARAEREPSNPECSGWLGPPRPPPPPGCHAQPWGCAWWWTPRRRSRSRISASRSSSRRRAAHASLSSTSGTP